MNLFEKDNYLIIREVVDSKICEFVYSYFKKKSQIAKWIWEHKKTDKEYWGHFFDPQVPNSYSHYGDIAMETLLESCATVIEKAINKKILPTYSYARLYVKGNVLERHKDRFSCEISTTMNLGGDEWAIYIEPDPSVGYYKEEENVRVYNEGKLEQMMVYQEGKTKGVKVILRPGDMMIYKGHMCEHWREKFTGNICGQVFFHYNNANTKGADKNKFDGRPFLGLPRSMCGLQPF